MSAAMLLTGLCLLILLGAALPLLRRSPVPPPPKDGWNTWADSDDSSPQEKHNG